MSQPEGLLPSSFGENYFEEYFQPYEQSDRNLVESISNVKLKKKIMSAHLGKKVENKNKNN